MREIWASSQMNAWFEKEWAGMAQIFTIRRTIKTGEKERKEQVVWIYQSFQKASSCQALAAIEPTTLED